MKTNEYLDKTKEVLKLKSDAKLADQLLVTRATVSSWRNGRTAPDDFACFQIGEILMIDPRKIISETKFEAEKNDLRKDFWKNKVKEYGFVSLSFALFLNLVGGIFYILC